MNNHDSAIRFRRSVAPDDVHIVRQLAESTGYFRPDEVDVAVELVETCLNMGVASGYSFIFAMLEAQTIGYVCYGPIACTIGSYDIYWIVVDRNAQGHGIGRKLMSECERLLVAAGARRVYVETSGKPQYESTRQFYHKCGYRTDAVLQDFYDVNDDKVILVKPLVCQT